MRYAFVTPIIISLAASASASAAEIAVLPVRGTNLDAGEAAAIGALIADAYAERSGRDVAQSESTAGASEYIETSVIKLSQKLVIRATLFGADGSPLWTADITTASLDDAPPAADRLARALIERREVADVVTIKNVTKAEATAPNRVATEKVMGVKTAFTYPVGGVQYSPMLSIQFDGRFEGDNYFLEFGAGLLLPKNDSGDEVAYGALFAEIGGSYYLSGDNIAPYIGAGISPRIVFNESVLGFAPYAQIGVMTMRESSSRLYLDLRVAQNLLPLREYEWESDTSEEHYPTEVTLAFGIGW